MLDSGRICTLASQSLSKSDTPKGVTGSTPVFSVFCDGVHAIIDGYEF